MDTAVTEATSWIIRAKFMWISKMVNNSLMIFKYSLYIACSLTYDNE